VGRTGPGGRGGGARAAAPVRRPGAPAAALRRARPAADAGRPPQTPAVPPQPAGVNERLAQLKHLGELLQAGVLTQAEFDQQKARILNN
jgi:hypothetical protein